MRRVLLIILVVALYFVLALSVISAVRWGKDIGVTASNLAPVGPEDLEVDTLTNPEKPRLLVSATDRRGTGDGAIWSVDPQGDFLLKMTIKDRDAHTHCDFRPHGISLVKSDTAGIWLFVINHPSQPVCRRNRVEGYLVDGDTLVYQPLSVWEPNGPMCPTNKTCGVDVVSFNDLDALPDGRIYMTNVPRSARDLATEAFVGSTDRSYVSFYNPNTEKWSRGPGCMRFPNGIAADEMRRKLYVSSSLSGEVLVYDLRSISDPARQRIDLDAIADNITLQGDGSLLVAAGSSGWRYLAHAMNASWRSPTEVWRVVPDPKTPVTTRIFHDSGAMVSAGSSAVCVKENLFIGQVFGVGVVKVIGGCSNVASRDESSRKGGVS